METSGIEEETALQLLLRLNADGLLLKSTLRSLDGIFSLLPGKCYEIDGDIGSGKTQLCYSLVAQFLRTKRSARIGWISAIPLRTDMLRRHLEEHEELDRVVCRTIENMPELRAAVDGISKTPNLKLVVVENVDALLHDTVYEREWGREVQAEFSEWLRRLNREGVTVVVTNHITHWRGYPAPALGAFWAQQIGHRFYVGRRDEDSTVRRISTRKEGSEEMAVAEFRIGDRGLEDVG